jgi:hypothetical protein
MHQCVFLRENSGYTKRAMAIALSPLAAYHFRMRYTNYNDVSMHAASICWPLLLNARLIACMSHTYVYYFYTLWTRALPITIYTKAIYSWCSNNPLGPSGTCQCALLFLLSMLTVRCWHITVTSIEAQTC